MLIAAAVAGLLGGCSKDEGTAPAPVPVPSAAMRSTPMPADSASASTATAIPTAIPTATPTPTPTATPTTTGKGAPTASAKPAATCGDKPMPPCPLYAWMKANTSAAMSAQDFDALAVALDAVVAFAPHGYGNWASISKDGANAARAQSLDGVKASCRGCHNQYKDKYKKEMRDRPI